MEPYQSIQVFKPRSPTLIIQTSYHQLNKYDIYVFMHVCMDIFITNTYMTLSIPYI